MDDSVYQIAGDDPRIAKLLRAILTKLAHGSDPLMKELAQGVLAGHVDLRHAATSPAYDEAFESAFDKFTGYYDQLDQHQRDQLVADSEPQLDELLDAGQHTGNPADDTRR